MNLINFKYQQAVIKILQEHLCVSYVDMLEISSLKRSSCINAYVAKSCISSISVFSILTYPH